MDNGMKGAQIGSIMGTAPKESTKHERLAQAVHRFDEVNDRLSGLRDRLTNCQQEQSECEIAGYGNPSLTEVLDGYPDRLHADIDSALKKIADIECLLFGD